MRLRPCGCGSVDFDPQHEVRRVQGAWLSRYTGRCRNCDTLREFVFVVDPPTRQGDRSAWSAGTEPSHLVDPGEWLAVADDLGRTVGDAVGADEVDDDRQCRRRVDLGLAADAVEEVLLAVPAGADAVPGGACRSELGRRVYAADPGRFRRHELELARDRYADQSGHVHRHRPDGPPMRARSLNEARLFIDLCRCDCGHSSFEHRTRWSPAAPGETRATLTVNGDCDRCGSARHFVFSVPADAGSGPAPDPLGAGFSHPGGGPSELVDPGQFLLVARSAARVADRILAESPTSWWTDDVSWEAVTGSLAASVAALQEVLTCIPLGADRMPATALRSATGRVVHHNDPQLFRRDRLVEAHAERDRVLRRLLAEHPEPDDDG
ncbi:hypothetical protein ACFO1B_01340 [Dactylosporangium siamense]|nr:hypothetical protein [Dactylosporangium siamense]